VKVLVCGSTSWRWPDLVEKELAALAARASDEGSDLAILTAGAGGADRVAEDAARKLGLDRMVFRSGWDDAGRQSTHDHVPRMVSEDPDLVLAFRDHGDSPGTDRIVAIALERGITVTEISPPD
jgi:YspA, cpYpsA-related SLOG family